MLSAGTVAFLSSRVSSMASQYASWEGWAIQSSHHFPYAARTGTSAVGSTSLSDSLNRAACPSCCTWDRLSSPAARDRCASAMYITAFHQVTRLSDSAPPAEYQGAS